MKLCWCVLLGVGATRSGGHGLVFIRVPKTGSTTVRQTIRSVCRALGYGNSSSWLDDKPTITPANVELYLRQQSSEGYHCQNQHVTLGPWLFQQFPALQRSLLVSVVREPVSYATSLLDNREGFCGIGNQTPLERREQYGDIVGFAERARCRLRVNGQFQYLGGGQDLFGTGVLETPLDVADAYDALFVIERLAESLIALLYLRPDLPPEIPLCAFAFKVHNANAHAGHNATVPQVDEKYRELAYLDTELYSLAVAKLDIAVAARRRSSFADVMVAYANCPMFRKHERR